MLSTAILQLFALSDDDGLSLKFMLQTAHMLKEYLRRAKNTTVSTYLFLLDSLLLFRSVMNCGSIKKQVLIVRLDRIGDFILWLDAAKEIRRLYPSDTYSLTIIGNDLWTELAGQSALFDEVWPLNRNKFRKNIIYRLNLMKKVRNRGFDVVLEPTFSRELTFGDAIVRVSGANIKIGSEGDYSNIRPWQKRISDRWYTRLVPTRREQLMELVRNAEFMRGLGLSEVHASVPELSLSSPTKSLDGDYVVLFPGASEPKKQWPLDRFLQIAQKIRHITGWTLVVCGGVEDQQLGNKMEKAPGFSIINKVGKTTLRELASVVAGARLVIGNDTSAIHIAAAVSTPSLCIVGGGHFGRFVPYRVETGRIDALPVVVTSRKECFGCNWKCIYPLPKDHAAPCVFEVTVEAVWQALQPLILTPRIVTDGKKRRPLQRS